MNADSWKVSLATLAALVACTAGCSRQSGPHGVTGVNERAKSELEAHQQVAAQTARTYHAMDNDALLSKLEEQSAAKREPFNSLAFRELRKRDDVDAGKLASAVRKTPNGDSLLPLLLLRQLHENSYRELPAELRAGVLTDALRNSRTFNTWGLPHAYLEAASLALIETGTAALPALREMLSDTRPAPMFGGQQVMEYERYKYRLCDYALFFIERIQGNGDFRMPLEAQERDSLIKGLQQNKP